MCRFRYNFHGLLIKKKKKKRKKKKSGSKFASNLDNSFSVSVIIIAYMIIKRREGKLKKKGTRTPLKIVGLFYAIVQ